MSARSASLAAAVVLGACAADAPYATEFDASAGEVTIAVLGDGFVRVDGERVPFEAVVLRLRQRTRAMSLEERKRFVVRVLAASSSTTEEVQRRTAADVDRMVDQLQIMGVVQVRLL